MCDEWADIYADDIVLKQRREQTSKAASLLADFVSRAMSERRPARTFWDALRKIRQAQAAEEFDEIR